MTIKDIAKLANVSVTTVSLILNNKDSHIREETRARVLKVIKEHNYRPNSVARSMITKKSNIIGLIIPDITNMYFAEMARAAESTAKSLGYSVILCNTDEVFETEVQYVQLLKEKKVDGLILVSTALSDHIELQRLKKESFPVVILDRKTIGETEGIVCFDNREAGKIAVNHLIEKGHHRIGCISGPKKNPSTIERLQGYKDALTSAGIAYSNIDIYAGDYKADSGEKGINALLDRTDLTAVFCLNDMMAYGAYKGIYSRGLLIPDDISIVGVDDSLFSSIIMPPLTSVRQPGVEMSVQAMKMLDNMIQEKDDFEKYISHKPELIIRGSVETIPQ